MHLLLLLQYTKHKNKNIDTFMSHIIYIYLYYSKVYCCLYLYFNYKDGMYTQGQDKHGI